MLNYVLAIEKTTFNATTTVAGTKRTRRAPMTDETILPIATPLIAASRTRPCIPAKLTITNETEANKNVWELFSETKYPTTKPKIARTPNIHGLVLFPATIPTITASTIPTRNAHAPIRFSLDLIGTFSPLTYL